MNTAAIYIKTQPEIKRRAQKVAGELGFSLSALMNAWLKQLIRTKAVNFSIRQEEPSDFLIRAIKQAEIDYKKGNTSPAFKSSGEAVAWLEKQGI